MRGSKYGRVKIIAVDMCRKNPGLTAIEVLAILSKKGISPLPKDKTLQRWRREADLCPKSRTYNGFSAEYKAAVVETAKTCKHVYTILSRLGPDVRGKLPANPTVREWLRIKDVTLGQDIKTDSEFLKPVKLELPDVPTPKIVLRDATLEIVDPDLYAGAMNPMLRNIWGRLFMDDTDEPWLVLRMWKSSHDGDRKYRIIPARRDPFDIWARSMSSFVEKAEEYGLRIAIKHEDVWRIAA